MEDELKRLNDENQYMRSAFNILCKNVIIREEKPQMELKPPEILKDDKELIDLTQSIAVVSHKFYSLEMELDYICMQVSKLTSTIAGTERNNDTESSKINNVEATARQPRNISAQMTDLSPQYLKLEKDLKRITSAWMTMKKKESIGTLNDLCEKQETACASLEANLNNANSDISGFEHEKVNKKAEYEKSDISGLEQEKANMKAEYEKSELIRLKNENQYMRSAFNILRKNVIIQDENPQMELKPPEILKDDKELIDLTQSAADVTDKFYSLEMELDNVYRKISQLTITIAGTERNNDTESSKKINVEARSRKPRNIPTQVTGLSPQCLKLEKDLELITSAWRGMTKTESDIKELKDKSLGQKIIMDVLDEYVTAEGKSDTFDIPSQLQSDQRFNKEREQANRIAGEFKKMARDANVLKAKSCYQETLLTNLDEYVTSKKQNAKFVFQSDQRFVKEKSQAERIAKEFEKKTSEMRELKDRSESRGILLKNLEVYATSKKQDSSFDIPNNLRLDKQFVKETKQAITIAQEFENNKRDTKELKAKNVCQGILLKNLEEYVTSENQNSSFVIPRNLQSDQKNFKEINQATRIAQEFDKMERYVLDVLDKNKQLYSLQKQNADMVEKKTQELAMLREERETLLTRLSEFIGDRLTHDNANIADVSDADRPTKLSEVFLELYDNEWTDAFEELTNKTSVPDQEAIKRLLDILMRAYRKCKEITWDRYELLKLHACNRHWKEENVPSKADEEADNAAKSRDQVVKNQNNGTVDKEEKEETDTDAKNTVQDVEKQDNGTVDEEEKEEADNAANNGDQFVKEQDNGTGDKEEKGETDCHKQSTSTDVKQEDGGGADEKKKKDVETTPFSLSLTLTIEQELLVNNIWRATSVSLKDRSHQLLYEMLSTSLCIPATEMPRTHRYLEVCIDLCWKMFMQEKPMYLDISAETKTFDTEKFRAYTKAGKCVAFVVWPALFLHEGGPMLSKGVAQGCSKDQNS